MSILSARIQQRDSIGESSNKCWNFNSLAARHPKPLSLRIRACEDGRNYRLCAITSSSQSNSFVNDVKANALLPSAAPLEGITASDVDRKPAYLRSTAASSQYSQAPQRTGVIPSSGAADGSNALALTSFTKELDWDEEVIAQMSVVASVFASAYAKKAASDAGRASELKFQHLFEDSPIGIALLDSGGQMLMSNETFGETAWLQPRRTEAEKYPECGFPEGRGANLAANAGSECRSPANSTDRKKVSAQRWIVIWARMTLSLAGTKADDGPYLLGMIEDVTATNLAGNSWSGSPGC